MFLPKLTWRRNVSEKVVYVTFDDGPHPSITPWVIAQLKNVGATATFFAVGENIKKYPEVVEMIRNSNHELGNHTMHHVKGWRMSAPNYLENIDLCEQQIGKSKRLFRPPYGQINFSAMDRIVQNYEVVMWDILTKDYLKRLNRQKALKRIKKATQPGSVVVFHDSEKSEGNLKEMLPEYLAYLQKEGYQMKAL